MMPDPDWVMPAQGELAITWIFGVFTALTIVQMIMNARATRSLFPLVLLIGCALSVFYEPTNDVLGHCFYPNNGQQFVWINVLGRKIPYYIGFTFFFYFYALIWYCMGQLERGVSLQKWMAIFFITVATAMCFELIPIHYGLWGYYGDNQPMKFFGFPVWWAFVNAECLMSIAVVLHLLRRHFLTGPAATLVGFITPFLTFMMHASAAMPVTSALNGSNNIVVTTIGSLTTICVATFMIWAGHRLAQALADRSAGSAAAPSDRRWCVDRPVKNT